MVTDYMQSNQPEEYNSNNTTKNPGIGKKIAGALGIGALLLFTQQCASGNLDNLYQKFSQPKKAIVDNKPVIHNHNNFQQNNFFLSTDDSNDSNNTNQKSIDNIVDQDKVIDTQEEIIQDKTIEDLSFEEMSKLDQYDGNLTVQYKFVSREEQQNPDNFRGYLGLNNNDFQTFYGVNTEFVQALMKNPTGLEASSTFLEDKLLGKSKDTPVTVYAPIKELGSLGSPEAESRVLVIDDTNGVELKRTHLNRGRQGFTYRANGSDNLEENLKNASESNRLFDQNEIVDSFQLGKNQGSIITVLNYEDRHGNMQTAGAVQTNRSVSIDCRYNQSPQTTGESELEISIGKPNTYRIEEIQDASDSTGSNLSNGKSGSSYSSFTATEDADAPSQFDGGINQ